MDSDKAILTSALLTLGSTTAYSVLPESSGGHGSLPSAKMLIGTGLAFSGLSMLGDIVPAIAVPLAASIAFTAMAYYGFPLIDCWMTPDSQSCRNFKKGKTKNAGR